MISIRTFLGNLSKESLKNYTVYVAYIGRAETSNKWSANHYDWLFTICVHYSNNKPNICALLNPVSSFTRARWMCVWNEMQNLIRFSCNHLIEQYLIKYSISDKEYSLKGALVEGFFGGFFCTLQLNNSLGVFLWGKEFFRRTRQEPFFTLDYVMQMKLR